MASRSSEPPECEWDPWAPAPALPRPWLTACRGNTGRARVKGRVRDKAEQKAQPEIMDKRDMDGQGIENKEAEKKRQAVKGRRKRPMDKKNK